MKELLFRSAGATLALSLFATLPSAQTPQSPAFEVASLRVAAPGAYGRPSPYGAQQWRVPAATVTNLLGLAFKGFWSVVGLPEWALKERYSVAAKAEDGVFLTADALRPRLRKLLEERFKLVAHIETRYVKGYALVVAKDGPKLTRATEDWVMAQIYPGRVRGNVTMVGLTGQMAFYLDKPVLNETGLTDTYSIDLTFAPESNIRSTAFNDLTPAQSVVDLTLPSIFTALPEQLGLRLADRDKVPMKMLVVDHIEYPTVD
jgi:uncharacterized protein (TIGR03435 family)